MTKEQFDQIKRKAEGFGYRVASRWSPNLRNVRFADIVLGQEHDLMVRSDPVTLPTPGRSSEVRSKDTREPSEGEATP